MEKIKVLEIIDKSFIGGGQRHLLSIAGNLSKEKFQVLICSEGGGPFAEKVNQLKIQHFPVSFPKKPNKKSINSLIEIIREQKISIVHTHGGVAGFFGRLAAKKCKVPVIIHTLHGIHYLHYRNKIIRKLYIILERWFSKFTDCLIFVSEADKKKAIKFKLISRSKMKVIKNGIDFSELDQFNLSNAASHEKKEALGIPLKSPILGTIARLHRQKGIPFLIRAMESISHHYSEAVLVIVGGGPMEEEIKDLISDLDLKEKIILCGEREDALELLSLFDIFILPSLWEGLPYVLMEAGGMKKPVIATSIDGVQEMIRDGANGLLVSAGNPDQLSEKILCLMRDKKLAESLAQEMEKDFTQIYDLAFMIKKIEALYCDFFQP